MRKPIRGIRGFYAALLTSSLFGSAALASESPNLTGAFSGVSHAMYDTHTLILKVFIGIGALIFGVMMISAIRYRSASNESPSFHRTIKSELAWMVVPILILVTLVAPSALSLIY